MFGIAMDPESSNILCVSTFSSVYKTTTAAENSGDDLVLPAGSAVASSLVWEFLLFDLTCSPPKAADLRLGIHLL